MIRCFTLEQNELEKIIHYLYLLGTYKNLWVSINIDDFCSEKKYC